MRIKTLLATTSLAVLGLSTMASADDEGWYLRGNAGYGTHTDIDLTDGNGNTADVESEGNVAGSLGVGYGFGNNWRVELDGDSLWTDLGAIGQADGTSAKLRTNSLMLNAIYDFDDFGSWAPYLGAGVGLVGGKLDAVINADESRISEKDEGLGWQLLAGLGYSISENLKWDTHYTYRDVGELNFDGTNNLGPITADASGVGSHSLLTGFRYLFGQKAAKPKPVVSRPVVQQVAQYQCWDGAIVQDFNGCARKPAVQAVQQYRCWDGEVVTDIKGCKTQTVTREVTRQRAVVQQPIVQRTNLNVCGSSNVGIFNVNTSATPKQLSRLGTLPEFGDSHNLSSTQFFEKLQSRYSSNAGDKAYLNYLFKSMGYSNGFADAQSYMFSEETLPVGTAGLLGLGKQHHYNYAVLPSNESDREAFRIQSANGTVVHFMKTCGNYFYGCE